MHSLCIPSTRCEAHSRNSFSTKHRTYKYFFVKEKLNIEVSCLAQDQPLYLDTSILLQRMREAAKKLEGEHDFRHFCKMDVVNVHNFVRTIHSFDITPAASGCLPQCSLFGLWVAHLCSNVSGISGIEEGSMYVMTICGQAFLWHQVRYDLLQRLRIFLTVYLRRCG